MFNLRTLQENKLSALAEARQVKLQKDDQRKIIPAELRILKDIKNLDLPKYFTIDFPNREDFFNFKLVFLPNYGYYVGGKFDFSVHIGKDYPFEPPTIKCETPTYHPNIDLQGNVSLDILVNEWKPIFTINTVVYALDYLFEHPNINLALNQGAANVYSQDRKQFKENVLTAMQGGYIESTYFEGCLVE